MSLVLRALQSNSDFQQRAQLLQKTMRQPQDPFAIEAEYPIVLGPHSSSLSLCGFENGELVAHLNLWPRILTSADHITKVSVALIGNVASREDVRGRGYTQALFIEAERLATRQGIDALFLWSDLHQFYQKLGFTSASRELRLTISVADHLTPGTSNRAAQLRQPTSLNADDYRAFLQLRPNLPFTIERSADEFASLATIPATFLFSSAAQDGFCVIGKGMDMQGVVHEWGSTSPRNLLRLIASAAHQLGLSEVMLLAPETLNPSWKRELTTNALQTELHNMAYAKALKADKTLEGQLNLSFIWGLDSI